MHSCWEFYTVKDMLFYPISVIKRLCNFLAIKSNKKGQNIISALSIRIMFLSERMIMLQAKKI